MGGITKAVRWLRRQIIVVFMFAWNKWADLMPPKHAVAIAIILLFALVIAYLILKAVVEIKREEKQSSTDN